MLLYSCLGNYLMILSGADPVYRDFRIGDVRHSLADINKAKSLINYKPSHNINEGLNEALDWYVNRYQSRDKDCFLK